MSAGGERSCLEQCRARDKAILASNTSSNDINERAAGVAGPDRIISTHVSPAPDYPRVEVIPGNGTSRENIDRIVKTSIGFYKYSPDAADQVRRKRDRMLYRRYAMFRAEQEG